MKKIHEIEAPLNLLPLFLYLKVAKDDPDRFGRLINQQVDLSDNVSLHV